MNLNLNPPQENYIHFKTPKLLIFNQPIDPSLPKNKNDDLEYRNHQLKKRIHSLNKLHRQNKEEQENYELNRNLANFYKNPFAYMEYLAKNYFIQQAKTLENLQIKQEMTENFKKLCNQIEDEITKFTENEEIKLKKLQKEVEKKLKEGIISSIDDPKIKNSENTNINNNNSNNMFQSSPVNMSNEEFMRRVFGNLSNTHSPLDGIITSGNATNFVINNKNSDLKEDNIYLNALSCLKCDKMVVPKNKFILLKDINLNDINQKKIIDTKNYSDLKNNFNNKKTDNDIKVKNKINNKQKKDKKNLEDLISYSNNYIKNMEQYQKEKEKLVEELKNKLNKNFEINATKVALGKLSVCEKNINGINLKYDKVPEDKIVDWEEKKEILEEDFRNTQLMVDNFLSGKEIINDKNKNKKNKNKKKRNFSAVPYNKNYFFNYNKKKP